MRAGSDAARIQACGIEIEYRLRSRGLNAKAEHLVEVAVVQSAGPIDADEAPTHQAIHGTWVEGVHQFCHIPFFVA